MFLNKHCIGKSDRCACTVSWGGRPTESHKGGRPLEGLRPVVWTSECIFPGQALGQVWKKGQGPLWRSDTSAQLPYTEMDQSQLKRYFYRYQRKGRFEALWAQR